MARQVDQERWRTYGTQTVATSTGPLSAAADRWRCVWETGHLIAVVDGVSALVAAGLRHLDDDLVHISVPHGCRPQRVPGVRLRRVVRRLEDELVGSGLPRTKAPVAAARAAAWAATDRQAALILSMVVQQRLATPAQLEVAAASISSRRRRRFNRSVIHDLGRGVQSLGELDFARMCRRRRLPEPSRQHLISTPDGRVYLDARWDGSRLVVEIDGAQHHWGLNATRDALRQNEVVLAGDAVLRMTLVGLRLDPERFMDQVCRAYERFRLPSDLPAAG